MVNRASLTLIVVFLTACSDTSTPTTDVDGIAVEQEPPAEALEQIEEGRRADGRVFTRNYHNRPPMVTHGVDGMLPITPEANACLECHVDSTETGTIAIMVPPSHVRNDGLATGKYECLACHKVEIDETDELHNALEGLIPEEAEGAPSS